jgi:hypothetical protein
LGGPQQKIVLKCHGEKCKNKNLVFPEGIKKAGFMETGPFQATNSQAYASATG